jgi:hypothetical protein
VGAFICKNLGQGVSMTVIRILMLIFISVFVGNIVVMTLTPTNINIWIIRLIGAIACAFTGIVVNRLYQKRSSRK